MVERPAGRRRTIAKADRGRHTKGQWQALLARTGHRCLCCGATGVKLVKDHIRPRSRGGTDDIDNLQPLCMPCNARKGARWIDYRGESDDGQHGDGDAGRAGDER